MDRAPLRAGLTVTAPGRVDRRGTTVVEAVAALLLGLAVVYVLMRGLVAGRVVVADLAAQADRVAAVRVARVVLASETAASPLAGETRPTGRDSLALRAYRGAGVVCGRAGAWLVLRVWGLRRADPAKDSVALLDRDGTWSVHALQGVGAPEDGCDGPAPDGIAEAWLLAPAPPARPLLGRFFERGSYHLAGEALRYRSGAGTRQPLTPEVIRTPPSGFVAADGRIDVLLDVRGAVWRLVLAGEGGGR